MKWDENENYDLDIFVSYEKDNPVLKLTLQNKIFFTPFNASESLVSSELK